jgi:glycosyltransferase involved in cell wall biosynthesis
MRILFLTEGTTVPATRFRVGQFLPHFAAAGIRPVVRHAYGDGYNRITQTALDVPYRVLSRAGRVLMSLDAGRFDLVFLQRPAFPFLSGPERLVHALNGRTLFDFDDSIFLDARGREGRRAVAFDRTVRTVAHNIAGNRWLAERAAQPGRTTVIPTVIDTDRFVPAPRSGAPVIGWMGTRGNFPSLDTVAAAVAEVLGRHPRARFRVVSNALWEGLPGHPRVERLLWSAETEIPLLQSFDVGLMPLPDNDLTRGKCGFKMIQYMAVGAAVVASPTGANAEIFEGSEAGALAETPAEWTAAMHRLLEDVAARRRAGEAARSHAVGYYSVRAVLPRYLELFERHRRPQTP